MQLSLLVNCRLYKVLYIFTYRYTHRMTLPCQTTDTVDLNMNEPKTADTHFTAIQSFYNGTNVFITGGTGDDVDQIANDKQNVQYCLLTVCNFLFYFFSTTYLMSSRVNFCLPMCIKIRLNRFHGQSHNWQTPSDVSGYWEYLFADKKEEGQRHTHTNRWALRWSGNASMNFIFMAFMSMASRELTFLLNFPRFFDGF